MDYLQTLLGAAGALKPHVVIEAPDGSQVWIPVPIPSGQSSSDGTPLWPNGFKVSLAIGSIPQAPHITDSPAAFIASHPWQLVKGFLSPAPK